ncbi:hypothetical protein A0H81_00152 [Grifola frondosa]|uniref:PHD-type domain-containing protein n=1 Tax=Grifola frondosa TaxID=5627 RepID=A0A1C7MQP9_GRIFR|nr:hypothetical protein A0H81_00152 [Grifola frondosa]
MEHGRLEAATSDFEHVTPKNIATSYGGLLPPFGMNQMAQLPTPQSSPSNADAYASNIGFLQDSPLLYGLRHSRPLHGRERSPPKAMTSIISGGSFITPDSSPILPRKLMPAFVPVAGPSSLPHTPRRPNSQLDMTFESSPLTPSHDHAMSSPSSQSRDMELPSRLSSPFVDNFSKLDHPATRSQSQQSSHAESRDVEMSSSLVYDPPSPLLAPVPQRAAGGEIERIRLQLAADQAARLHETEARRPEYLVREKRPRSVGISDPFDPDDHDSALPGLGVTVSPNKGRRLTLFQETSEESFEQSLLAGGYPGYGHTPAYGEPQTPQGKTALSQGALQWLHQSTPGQSGPSNVASEPEPNEIPSEHEIKKRRLAAFRDDEEKVPLRKLFPLDVEGQGRVLAPFPEMPSVQSEPPAKKRGSRRRKKGSKKKGQVIEPLPNEEPVLQPDWVDSVFPWCMRTQERTEIARLEQEEKLKVVEQYLSRDSDDDADEKSPDSEFNSQVNGEAGLVKGRGSITKDTSDALKKIRDSGSFPTPNDPADARAALLTRKSVRALVHRKRAERAEEEDVCICQQKKSPDELLVQCDDCKVWYHFSCVGLKSESELGEEEDPWYCQTCLNTINNHARDASTPFSEPVLAPDDHSALDATPDQWLFPAHWPSAPWTTSLEAPKTPVRSGEAGQISTLILLGLPRAKSAPSTPDNSARSARVYTTPTIFDRLNHDDSPFDPTTTPSRIKVGQSFTTPKNNFWSNRSGGLLQTPSRYARDTLKHSGGLFSFDDSGGPFSSPANRNIYSYDDTPIRRAKPREEPRSLFAGHPWDSPLPHAATVSHLQESPSLIANTDERSHVEQPIGAGLAPVQENEAS